MLPSRVLDQLHAYQSEVLELIGRGEAMLMDGGTRDAAGLARIRWALIRTMTAYQLFKHGEIFDPGLLRAGPLDTLRLTRMKLACTNVGDALRAHVQKWSATDTQSEWPIYRAAALAMAARLRAHIIREREEVTAILMRGDHPPATSLTPSPATVPPRPDRPTPAG